LLIYNIRRRCRSRDTSSASSNWNATATSSDGKAILWNLNTGSEYEIMVTCRDEMSGESMFSKSILTSRSKGIYNYTSVFTNYYIHQTKIRNIILTTFLQWLIMNLHEKMFRRYSNRWNLHVPVGSRYTGILNLYDYWSLYIKINVLLNEVFTL